MRKYPKVFLDPHELIVAIKTMDKTASDEDIDSLLRSASIWIEMGKLTAEQYAILNELYVVVRGEYEKRKALKQFKRKVLSAVSRRQSLIGRCIGRLLGAS